MTGPTIAIAIGGERHTWDVPRLWDLSRDLPLIEYVVADFDGFDRDCWYGRVHVPTIRSVLEHHRRIAAADLSYPIILSESGAVMDGIHRVCKAWLAGTATIDAVRFTRNPKPDRIEPYPTA